MISMNINKGHQKGFTLLELLIVISIIAILSVALVLVLNPAEALRKSRDVQRLSDLNTMKNALGIYLTSTSNPELGGTGNAGCKATPTTAWAGTTNKIYYSLPISSAITDTTLDGSSVAVYAQSATPALTNGTGWVPVNFDSLSSGSPISNLPVDPINTIATLSAVATSDLVYRYACSVTPLAFEMDAQLESTAYTSTDNKLTSDGGNNSNLYEVGTNLNILGSGTDF